MRGVGRFQVWRFWNIHGSDFVSRLEDYGVQFACLAPTRQHQVLAKLSVDSRYYQRLFWRHTVGRMDISVLFLSFVRLRIKFQSAPLVS